MRTLTLGVLTFALACSTGMAQKKSKFSYPVASDPDKVFQANEDIYTNTKYHHEVKEIKFKGNVKKRAKNVILMVSDGTGTTQFFTAIAANHNKAYIEQMPVTGFSKTASSDRFVTDSAAGATAFSIGEKTYNHAIGVDKNKQPKETILETAEKRGLSTGVVATSKITHATPAAFIAHQEHRNMYEAIAADFVKSDVDLFIGGGRKEFVDRKDGRNLEQELKDKGFTVINKTSDLANAKGQKIAGLLADDHMPRFTERGEMLETATKKAIDVLSQNKKGFFLMVEGSQVDWGGHANNTSMITEEVLDFDKTLGAVLEFAAKDGNTLVIVTADHETGGYSVPYGSMEKSEIVGRFTSPSHTAVMVPVFAFGPGSEEFMGTYENNEIYHKMMKAFRFRKEGI
ncbi:alkaline phosphatase [Fulvitalea axinellae]